MLLDVERVAHGGFCIAHAPDGRAVFVRHALPGERVEARVTEERARYLRADAVDVLTAAPGRVAAPCPWAGPGRCGGCDWQHVALPEQRLLKAAVVAEQLHRLAKLDVDVVVEPVPGDDDGLGWRTRVRFAVDADGRAGLRRHRSHEIEPIGDCLIAHPDIEAAGVVATPWPGADTVEVEVGAPGDRAVTTYPPGPQADARLTERTAGGEWQVPVGGFWQVHPGAADVLVPAVLQQTAPREGDRCLDLYSGVGLFTRALAERTAVPVVAVESDAAACDAVRDNVAGADIVAAKVEWWLPRQRGRFDVVVLDPPRRGAGARVVQAIAAREPRVVSYVACDPASLARDVATFADLGYRLTDLRAFDLFPMTAHVECVARLERAA